MVDIAQQVLGNKLQSQYLHIARKHNEVLLEFDDRKIEPIQIPFEP